MAESVKYRKVYVGVELSVSPQGDVRPRTIIFEDGNKYQIDRLRQKCRAHATKVGGTGIRYTVIICNKQAAQNGDFDEQFRCLHNEMYAIMDELEAADKTKSKLETASGSIGEIATVISGLKNHPVEYNDLAVRQLIECIKVMSADTIHIYFKDGTMIKATL